MTTEALPIADSREIWRELRGLVKGHRLKLGAVAVLGVVSAATGLVSPMLIGHLVDRVRDGSADLGTVLATAGAMVAAVLLGSLSAGLTVIAAARSYHAMLAELREKLFARGMELPQGLVERAGTGDLISRTSDDVSEVADAASSIIPAFVFSSMAIAVNIVGISVMDWRFGLALVVVLPIYILTVRWYVRTAPALYQAERSAMTHRAQQLIESQRGFDTVRGLGLVEARHASVLDAAWSVAKFALRACTMQNIFFGRLNVAEFIGTAAILTTGFWLVGTGDVTIGGVTAAVLLFLRLFGPINQLLFVFDTLQSALASLGRMVGVVTMPAAPAALPHPGGPDHTGARLQGVGFSYDGEHSVLEDVDLRIPPGTKVAVVGASGAGKTTLAAVLAGIHQPTTGEVVLPSETAVVTQEVHVFAGTLRENMTLASPEASDDDIRRALAVTGASALLDLLPGGLDAVVGAAGKELTAAQSQQLALARLVLADPAFAILDEATAEAGSTHAGLLDRAADSALAGRTSLVIAHRLSQAAVCDQIVVMADGRIVERGTHDELVAQPGGLYASLWEAWAVDRAQ